jgi:hypothetical protein
MLPLSTIPAETSLPITTLSRASPIRIWAELMIPRVLKMDSLAKLQES